MNTKVKNYPRTISLLAIFLGLLLSACGSSDIESIVVEEAEGNGLISVSNSQFTSSGMSTGRLESTVFNQVINCNGLFEVPPPYRASVSVFFGGHVKEIFHLPGQKVKKGEVLMTMENPLYIQMQEEFLEIRSKLTYLEADLNRQKALLNENAVSQKQFAVSLSDYEVVKAKYEGLRKKLALIHINANGLTAETISSSITITSPIDGYITEVNASKGMFLQASDPAFKILNNDHMHLELVVFESDAHQIKEEQQVSFRVPGDEKTYHASVHLAGKTIDAEKRSVNIHCHLEEEQLSGRFIPGMYVEAVIYISGDTAMALPSDAVVEIDDEFFVLLKKSSDTNSYQFEKRKVSIGVSRGGMVAISNAKEFSPGDVFLIKGAFNLIQD